MAKIWQPNPVYRFFRPAVDLAIRTSFKRVRVSGHENIPEDGAVIFAPNHCNAMLDPLLVLQSRREATSFGARSDMFRKPAVARMFRFFKMVPLARIRNGADAVKGNIEVFDEVADILVHGVPFCIFAEGRHHAAHTVLPLSKGIWRIAELAASRSDKAVYIVPVGLDYQFLLRFASDVDIRFGKPIELSSTESLSAVERNSLLQSRIQELLLREDLDGIREDGSFHFHKAERMAPAKAAATIATLPLAAFWALLAAPMLIVSGILCGKAKDKTWLNTIRFAVRFLMSPLLAIIYGLTAGLLAAWWVGLILAALTMLSFSAFHYHKNNIEDLFNSIKR